MLRWLAAGAAAVLLVVAAISFLSTDKGEALPAPPAETAVAGAAAPLPAAIPQAIQTPEQREAKRLSRYDRDRDGAVSREEYLRSRQRAFAKLDLDGDGRLDFAEYAVKTAAKFDVADRDRNGALSGSEFATTAATRKSPAKAAACPPTAEADS